MNIGHTASKIKHVVNAYINRNDIFNTELRRMSEWHYSHIFDPSFSLDEYRNDISEFWTNLVGRQFGINRIEQEYFSRVNGIKSETYVPMGVYYYLITPYLNRWPFRRAYEDKNMFHTLLHMDTPPIPNVDVKMPYTVLGRMNGKWFAEGKSPCTETEALETLAAFKGDMIVKPTNDTWGHGVRKLTPDEVNAESFRKMQEGYGLNFTVQQCIKQHTKMASFNESSVNTVRVYTYFNSNGEYEILRTVQRFGGKGSVVDNASAGGGYCLIRSDGIVDRNIFRSLSMGKSQLESGVTKEIPSYDKICCATLELHRRLPYFDLIGWDMAVDEDGIPVVLEYNCVAPSIDIPQTAGGPLFSEEELLKLMPKVFNFRNNVKFAVNQISWEDKDNYLWTDDYSFYV